MNIEIKIIDQLIDNYSYIIYSKKTNEALLVDPSEPKKIFEYIETNKLKLKSILITHHHSDHTKGIEEIIKKYKIKVFSPNIKIKGTTDLVNDKQVLKFGFINFIVISTPGHTLDHIVYYCDEENLLFSGDTLFYSGCGRVFEGTYIQMLESLEKLKKLPNDTKIFCGHEYSLKNIEFVLDEILNYSNKEKTLLECRNKIEKNGSTMPFLLSTQKDINPFLNCSNSDYKRRVANFPKNKGKISPNANDLEFFTFIREKRNNF